MKIMKKFIVSLMLICVLLSNSIYALDLTRPDVRVTINGVVISDDPLQIFEFNASQTLQLEISFPSNVDDNLTIVVNIDSTSITNQTSKFEIINGTNYTKQINLVVPSDVAEGEYTLNIIFNPDNGGPIDISYTIRIVGGVVPPVNNVPVITSSPVLEGNVNQEYNYDVDATDADSDVLTYSLENAPTGMVIDSSTGLINWTPLSSQVGDHQVKVVVSDGIDNDTQSFTLNVIDPTPQNSAPVITSSPVLDGSINVEYSYNVDAADSDGDALTYSLENAPNGMVINATSGLITWTPASSQVGDHQVKVVVSDGNLTDSQIYTVSILGDSKLSIKDLEVEVGSKSDKDVKNGDTISKEAEPGDKVSFEIEIENLYDDNDENASDIDDILVEVTIVDIDDGEDLEEESKEFNLNPEEDEKITLTFNLPVLVDEDTYDVIIDIEGEDDNNVKHKIKWLVFLKVEKEKHDIRIDRASLSPDIVRCERSVNLDTKIVNVGSEDEDEVALIVESDELGLLSVSRDINLDSGNDEDSEFEKSISIFVSSSLGEGSYPITIKAYYDDDKLSDSRTIMLDVGTCSSGGSSGGTSGSGSGSGSMDEEEEDEEEDVSLVVIGGDSQTQGSDREEVEETTLFSMDITDLLLILGAILLFGILIFAIGAILILIFK